MTVPRIAPVAAAVGVCALFPTAWCASEATTPPADLLVVDGSALVALRPMGQWLGARIGYDSKTLEISVALANHSCRLRLKSTEASVDGRPVALGAPPMEVRGVTYIPLTFLSLYLAVPVDWDAGTGTATIHHPVTGTQLVLRAPGGSRPPAPGSPEIPGPQAAQAPAPSIAPGPRSDGPDWLHVAAPTTLPTEPTAIYMSEDGAHWAYVSQTNGDERMLDDRALSTATYCRCRPPQFAPVTGRLGFWAQTQAGQTVLVIDGQEIVTPFSRPGLLVFSPDGRRWAALGWQDGGGDGSRAVGILADGAEIGRYWDAGLPRFSPDSSHLAFLAVDSATQQVIQWLDGQTTVLSPIHGLTMLYEHSPNMTFQTDLEFAPDGSLYTLLRTDRGWEVRVGSHTLAVYGRSKFTPPDEGPAGGAHDAGYLVYPSSLVTAARAPVAAWWARPRQEDPWVCYVNGRSIPATGDVDPAEDRLVLSPDGQRVIHRWRHFEGQGENREEVAQSVALDGKPGGKYQVVEQLQFSPDSRRVAYRAQRPGAWMQTYVIDGKPAGPEAEELYLLTFSTNGAHYAYAARRGPRAFVVCDGRERPVPGSEVLALEVSDAGDVNVVVRDGRQLIAATSGLVAGVGAQALVSRP